MQIADVRLVGRARTSLLALTCGMGPAAAVASAGVAPVTVFEDHFDAASLSVTPVVGSWQDVRTGFATGNAGSFRRISNAGSSYDAIFPDRPDDDGIVYVDLIRSATAAPTGTARFDLGAIGGADPEVDPGFGEVAFDFRNRTGRSGDPSLGRLELELVAGTTAVGGLDAATVGSGTSVDADGDEAFDDGSFPAGPRRLAWVYNTLPRTLERYGETLPAGSWRLFDLGGISAAGLDASAGPSPVAGGSVAVGTNVDGLRITVSTGIGGNYAFDNMVAVALTVPEPTAGVGGTMAFALVAARRRRSTST